MKKTLRGWAIANRIFWGIISACELFVSLFVSVRMDDFMWFLYGTIAATGTYIVMFAFADLLSSQALLMPDDKKTVQPPTTNAPMANYYPYANMPTNQGGNKQG